MESSLPTELVVHRPSVIAPWGPGPVPLLQPPKTYIVPGTRKQARAVSALCNIFSIECLRVPFPGKERREGAMQGVHLVGQDALRPSVQQDHAWPGEQLRVHQLVPAAQASHCARYPSEIHCKHLHISVGKELWGKTWMRFLC